MEEVHAEEISHTEHGHGGRVIVKPELSVSLRCVAVRQRAAVHRMRQVVLTARIPRAPGPVAQRRLAHNVHHGG